MEKQTMPEMEDGRVAIRFTQNEQQTYAALVNPDVPEWQREFIRYQWYAKIPVAIWNDQYLRLSKPVALRLLKGEPVRLDESQMRVVNALTEVAKALLSRGILPTKDARTLPGIYALYVEFLQQQAALNQQQPAQQTEGV